MTRDDIIRMARAAGMTGLDSGGLLENFERFAALVAAFEREACAKLCDWLNGEPRLTPAGCAAAIRARGASMTKDDDDTMCYRSELEAAAWTPIEQPYPLAGKLDILLGDGSILCGVLPQEEGDLWWSGTAEKFIDPQYYDITHWRIHCDTAAIRARGQDPMPLFDDWNKDWK